MMGGKQSRCRTLGTKSGEEFEEWLSKRTFDTKQNLSEHGHIVFP